MVSTKAPIKGTEKRFPKAAVDYVDALLEVQRRRFEREQAVGQQAGGSWPTRPTSAQVLAEGDDFVGSGWGPLDTARDGTKRRWMARLGTIMLPVDASKGGTVHIKGGGFLRRRFVSDLTVWLDGVPVSGVAVRQGFNRWQFTGAVAVAENRPFHILRLQSPGIKRYHLGPETHASLAVSEIRFSTD